MPAKPCRCCLIRLRLAHECLVRVLLALRRTFLVLLVSLALRLFLLDSLALLALLRRFRRQAKLRGESREWAARSRWALRVQARHSGKLLGLALLR